MFFDKTKKPFLFIKFNEFLLTTCAKCVKIYIHSNIPLATSEERSIYELFTFSIRSHLFF